VTKKRRNTPGLDRLFQNQETHEQCPCCEGVKVAGETCTLCLGAGTIAATRAAQWRLAQKARKHGPLPPMNPPPKDRRRNP
jgi:hypothetical protein